MSSGGLMAVDIDSYIRERAKDVDAQLLLQIDKVSSDAFLERLLGKARYKYNIEAPEKSILDPTWYFLGLGGKRWRPVLMLLFIEALGKNPEEYIEFSTIPEIIHNSTLIHDDLEDNSLTRRGSPAIHVKYGVDVATNLGDFLFFFPMHILMNSKKLSSSTKNKAFNYYLQEMTRVTVGQATDIAWHAGLVDGSKITEKEYLQMTNDKTGVLAQFACQLAGVLAGAKKSTIKKIGRFGASIGIAFQIQDDLLNIYESKVSQSKGGIGDDIAEGKITLMVIHALRKSDEEGRKRLLEILSMHTKDQALIREAIAIIDKSGAKAYSEEVARKIITDAWDALDPILPPSDAKDKLKAFADFSVSRSR